MGAAAGKQFQSDKAKHAAAVLNVVQSYEKSHPGELDDDDYRCEPGLFKRRVLLAAAEAKRNGHDVDRSLSQLTDADLDTLRAVVEQHRLERNERAEADNKISYVTPVPFDEDDAQLSDEEDNTNGNDNIDETTSVLSYGDGELPTARDSDGEVDSSGSNVMLPSSSFHGRALSRKGTAKELEEKDSFYEEEEELHPGKLTQEALKKLAPRADNGIAEALAKFWDMEDMEAPSGFSPSTSLNTPLHAHMPGSGHRTEDSMALLKKSLRDRGQRIDEQNETLMGLQRQKVMSYTQNAQLEREVEALQRQLEHMEQLERSSPMKKSMCTSSSRHGLHAAAAVHPEHRPAAPIAPAASHSHSHASSIFPIDEEGRDWQRNFHRDESKRGQRDGRDGRDGMGREGMGMVGRDGMGMGSIGGMVGRKAGAGSPPTSGSESEARPGRGLGRHFAHRAGGAGAEDKASKTSPRAPRQPGRAEEQPLARHAVRRRQRMGMQQQHSLHIDSDDSTGQAHAAQQHSSSSILSPSPSSSFSLHQGQGQHGKQTKASPTAAGTLTGSGSKKSLPLKTQPSANSLSKDDEALKAGAGEGMGAGAGSEEDAGTGMAGRRSKVQKDGALKGVNKRRHSLDGSIAASAPSKAAAVAVASSSQAGSDSDAAELQLSREDYKSPTKRTGNKLKQRIQRESSLNSQREQEQEAAHAVTTGEHATELQTHAGDRKRKTRASGGSKMYHQQQQQEMQEAKAAAAAAEEGPWTQQLDYSWTEVSLLLRKPIRSEEDLQYTAAAAEAGIIFTDQMNSLSKSLHVLRGALSRWLLPFDNNTRIESQCSTPHSVLEAMPDDFRGKLSERQVHYLVAGANGVRRLVRIKIADDNDLEQARQALCATNTFFKLLYERAEKYHMSPFELLKQGGVF